MIPDNFNSSTPIYRYIDFPHLMALLFTESLCFTKVSHFPDKNEFTDHNLMNIFKYVLRNYPKDLEAFNSELQNRNEFTKKLNRIRGRIYASCWSAKYDDYALWKIYTKGNPFGICIESTIGNVLDSLWIDKKKYTLYQNRVDYEPKTVPNMERLRNIAIEQKTEEIVKFLPFVKIPSYHYEQEYRFILYRNKNINEDGINVKCDLLKLIVTMHYSPFMPEWFKKALRKYMDELFNGDRVIKRKAMERLLHLGNINDKSQIVE